LSRTSREVGIVDWALLCFGFLRQNCKCDVTSHPGFGVDVGAIAKQDTQNVCLVGTSCKVKCCFTTHCGRVGVSAVLK